MIDMILPRLAGKRRLRHTGIEQSQRGEPEGFGGITAGESPTEGSTSNLASEASQSGEMNYLISYIAFHL
jgi:hypothetical protein